MSDFDVTKKRISKNECMEVKKIKTPGKILLNFFCASKKPYHAPTFDFVSLNFFISSTTRISLSSHAAKFMLNKNIEIQFNFRTFPDEIYARFVMRIQMRRGEYAEFMSRKIW